ncbi:Mitochondrial uncoupling protein Bmcp [Gryllus bimaculatus]|nr:Mitochondrial uncoupling protein Bmcp [Gryllus bimaculatus]
MPITNETRRRLGATDYAIAGSLSGMTSRFLTQPLDVVKIRFQLQVEPIHKLTQDAYYKGVTHAFKKILREEGATALWKGHVSAQLLSIVYGFTQFSSFEVIARNTPGQTRHDPYVQFACGAMAGFIATIFSFPFDVIRTRFVAQGEPKVLHSHLGDDDSRNSVFAPMPVKGALICGSLAGIFTKTVVYPFDLIRKRMQVQERFISHQANVTRMRFFELRGYVFRCVSFIDCFSKTIKEERIRGLFKGLVPSTMKAGTMTAINFCAYEQVCVFIAKRRPDPAEEP